ncbi:MAG: MBG domain-containing protein, partial [Clostridia bacterium]
MRRSANKKLWAKVAITLIASVFIILIATINGSGIVELFKSNPSAPSEETVDNSLDTIAEENPPLYLASKIDDNGGIAIGGGSANTGYPINTSDISVGKFHTIIADIDGFVYTRGSNEQQQLGLGAGTTNWNIDNATYHYNYLQPVVALNDYTITKVAAGGFHSLVIGYDHTKGAIAGNNYVVFTWGMQNNGRLGNGSSAAANIGIPQNISSRFAFAADEYPIDVSAGDHHSMLITNKGNLFTWGCNSDGQLGRGNTTDSNVPIKITTQAGRYMRISAGSVHSLALLNNNLGASNGELWSWGGNSRRQVGEVTTATVSTPARRFSSYTFTHIAAGELHSLAMNGALAYGWGDQRGGKLGDGQGQGDIQESSRHQHALTQITGQTWKANSASAGIGSFLITSGNELFAFGYGADTYYGTGNANTTIPRTTSIGSVSQVDRGLVVFTDNKIQHFGNLTHYSENWYGKASPPTLNGYINTTPNATYNVTKASAEMRTHVTPYKNIIGLPTVYSRSTNTNAVAAVHGVVFTVGRVKITSFHPTADNGGLAVAQVTKAVYDAATTTSSGGATFQSSGAKSYVLSREGYYVVRYKQNDTVVYKKFEIANASGPEVVINTQENQNNVFATISIYDGFGLKSLSINGQAWEPGGTTSTYSASSGDFPSDTNSIVYNTTFTITKNSINTFAVVATDLKGTTTSMNIDIDTVVYLNTANASKLYDGQPLPIEPVFYSKARGGFGLTTFNNVYGTNGYSATPIVYKKGATTLDGAPVDAAPEPYKASYSILKGGSAILTRETDILIGKATPIFPQHHAINIKYGQSLSAAGMPHAINPYDSGIGVEGEFEWQTPEIIPALNNAPTTTTEYLFNFDPIGHDATNYHSVTGIKANVTANLSTSLARIAFGADAATNTYDYDWETTKVVNNKARVGIKAVQNDSANYIFLGWQKGGNYKSINHSYVYEMVSEMPAETDTTFTAVFAQYRLNNNLVKQVDELYTGTPRRVNVDVDLFSQNPGLYRIGLEISSDVAPTGIGTYEVSFTIINTELGLPVFSPTIIFNVLETDVIAVIDIANSDGYNAETGWANSVAFRLSVSGTASGAVQKYIYSKDNGVTWQDVPGTPAAQPGCPIIFVAAAASEGQSYSESYIFKAVHATHGAGTHKSVASSTEEVHCKIDTVTPTISVNFANGYASEWINQDVTFDISATSGGSGIIIYYSTDGGESWTDTQLTSYNYGMTEQPIVNYDDLIFTRSDEQNLTYTFRVETGTSRNVILEDSFVIKIDKTAPIIAKTGITQTPNENGWIKDTAVVTLSITDVKADYSGILSITVDNDAAYTINSGEINPDNNSVYIFVPDYKVYTVTATDIAGNISTLEVWEKVDTKNPDFIVEGYTAGEWINDIANFVFTINAGASGVKVRYSIDGGASYNYWTEGDFLTTDEGAFQTIVAEHSLSEEQHNEYIFSVESGAGRITDITFGYVNIDKTAPDIVDDDPVWSIILANYKGDSPWRNEDVDMKFVARDTHELFNSGIDHSKVIVTNVGENVPAVHHGDGKYLFVVDKCTEYVISITDIAGNTTTANYTLKVDQGEPSFTSEAYIGETDELYTFAEDLWLSRASYGDNAFVRFVFNMNFTPSGAKMQFSTDGKDAGDSTKVWIDLTEVLFEEGNENGLEQNVTIRVDVKNQQNNPYMVRIISGSERVMEGENLGRIRIDFTPPVFETPITYYFNGTTLTNYNTITTVWGYEDIETRFKPGDTPSGVATVEVRRYAIGADHTNPSTPYTQAVITEKDGLSSFNMQEYAKFVIIMTDRAGNIFVNDPIMPRIDKTEGFSFTVDTNGYESGSWIYDEGVNVRFDFPVVFDPESGFSTFGPSGAALEFSINNGLWLTESLVGQTTQAVQNNGTLNPYMIAEVSQIRTYRFRLRTGTGRVYYDEGTYTVNKDTIQPTVTSTAKANGENYLGQWTYHNVDFTLNMVVGPSGAKYYWASSASPTITSADELIWEERGTLNESVGAERTYSVNTTTNGVYYYFRIVAGTGVSNFTTEGKLVKIDKATVSATATPYYNDTLYTGDWVSGSVEILVRNVNSGPSGYTVQYQTRRIGSDVYGEYLDAGYNTAENVLTLSNNTQNEYRLRLISGAGREYHTVVIPVKIDNEIPEFALFSSGTSLSAPLQNAGWWISDLSIIYNVTHTGESGYVLQYATSDDGVTWSEWTAEKINGNTMLLTDESGYGGTRAFYKMRALSGAGVSSVENNYGEIKIDTNTYTISAEQYVSGTLGNYATITNIISDYRRGDIVDSAINMTSGYFLKSLLVKSGEDIIKSEVPGNFHTVTSGFTMEISGENVTVELSCYKQISIIYNNRHQYLQDNQITPSFITVSEAGFNDTYGELDFSITYNGSLTVPQEIGVYTLTATVADDSFIIINPAVENRILTVVYFSGDGYEGQNPYLISSVLDMTYIDFYMSLDSEYNYLGMNRRRAAFLQTQDIELPANFSPIGSDSNRFAGNYDGGNFKVFHNGGFTASDNFGFFGTLDSGARVHNLGIEFDLVVAGENISAGLLAAETYSAEIIGVYAIGSIKVSGRQLNIGGLIGLAWNSTLSINFTDVTIYASDAAGNIGGVLGL